MTDFEKIEKAFWLLAAHPDANFTFDRGFIMAIYINEKMVGELTVQVTRGYTSTSYFTTYYVKDVDSDYSFKEMKDTSYENHTQLKEKIAEIQKETEQKWKAKRTSVLDKLAGL